MKGSLVVVGDALLDVDLEGTAGRLAPDSPVPVLDQLVERPRPGGAALAALMAARDGHRVTLVTALGDDDAGRQVEDLLGGVEVVRLGYDGPTPVKTRVRSRGQSLVRLDSGTAAGAVTTVPERVSDLLSGAAVVLVADYGRGVTSCGPLRGLLADLVQRVPVVWDPHPRGTSPVPGVRLVTPNEAEAEGFAEGHGSTVTGGHRLTSVAARADRLLEAWQARAVAVTLGEHGALLSYGSGAPVVTPAPDVSCVDPCGAGDRFAVSAAVALGSGLLTTEAVGAAVAESAAYVAAGGPASLETNTPASGTGTGGEAAEQLVRRISQRGGVVVATGGCFDLLHAGHVATLRAARRLGDCLVVCLNSDDSVRRLKGPSRPLVSAVDRARVLEALECVDAVVVFDEDTPVEAIRRLRPHVWAKGGDYAGADVPEGAVLAEWGGQAVVLPYLRDRSTSRMVEAAVRGVSADRSRRAHGTDTSDEIEREAVR
jgi:rfaE bifunctional protein nucleotidyltransferase chain/domain/rfaE bifunctional protein kinase chain/domain